MRQSRNSIMRGARGALGEELVFRQRGGKTVISIPAVRRIDRRTDEQLMFRERFRQAVMYARNVVADPAQKALYQTIAKPGVPAYNMAFRDRFKAPVITEIDIGNYSGSPGDLIRIAAADDFRVERVLVSILSATGTVVEEGPAVAGPEGTWFYTAIITNTTPAGGKVIVQVSDLPGNITAGEASL